MKAIADTVTWEDIAAAMGEAPAQALIAQRGGTQLRIPTEPTGMLVELIGVAALTEIVRKFPGERINIPSAAKLFHVEQRAETRATALDLRRQGCTIVQIASRLQISESTVYRYLAADA